MNVWARRLIYGLLAVIWLMIMAFPVVAVVLAAQGEIQVGHARSARQARLFLIQERDHEGLGLEWTTPASTSCQQGRIIYLMWQGNGENARFCTCVDDLGAVVSTVPGVCTGT